MVFNHTKGKKGSEPVTGPTVLPPKLKGLMIVDAGYLSSRKYGTRPLLPVGMGLKKYRRHTLSQDGLSCLRAVDSGLLCNPRNPFCPNPTTGFRLKPWQNMDQFSEGRLGGRAIQQRVSHFFALANVFLGTSPRELSYPANESRSFGHTDRPASIQLIEGV